MLFQPALCRGSSPPVGQSPSTLQAERCEGWTSAQPGVCNGVVQGREELTRRCSGKVAVLGGEDSWELLHKQID